MSIELLSLGVGAAGLLVALLAYRHQRGTEPWKLTKVDQTLWTLERQGRGAVFITLLLNFHGTQVVAVNDAGAPFGQFKRGRSVLLRLDPSVPGTSLTVFYRRVKWNERKLQVAPEYEDPEAITSHSNWSAPIY